MRGGVFEGLGLESGGRQRFKEIAELDGLVTMICTLTRTGRTVLEAKRGRQALAILRDQMCPLDFVIVDIDPGAHGLALLEAISACADRQ